MKNRSVVGLAGMPRSGGSQNSAGRGQILTILQGNSRGPKGGQIWTGQADLQPINLRQARENAERQAVSRALAQSDGSIAQAAELLGITRPTLYDLMAKIGLK